MFPLYPTGLLPLSLYAHALAPLSGCFPFTLDTGLLEVFPVAYLGKNAVLLYLSAEPLEQALEALIVTGNYISHLLPTSF